jgi:hypothetical protein
MNNERENRWSSRGPGSRLFFAGFLIVAGTLLFLGNLGVLPRFNIWSFWPLLIVVFGISRIVDARDAGRQLFGFLTTVFGVVFLLISLGVFHIRDHDHSWPISMLLIAFGMAMLIKVLDRGEPGEPMWSGFRRPPLGDAAHLLSDLSIMGSVKRRLDASDFRGGSALSILANIELDFRHSRITDAEQTIYLEVSAILGGAKIRVPEGWRVRIRGAGILGTYEDKTVPSAAGSEGPTLVVSGYAFLGSVEIED